MSSDALEYFYGITPERLDAMRNTPPPKSTDEAWKEHYRLQEEYIEELEAEIEEKRKDVVWLATEKAKLENYVTELENRLRALWDKYDGDRKHYMDRIKRIEEAGDKAILNSYLPDRLAVWNKAKEAKP